MKALYTFLLIASVAVFSLPAKAQWEQINSLYGGTVVDLLENSSGTLFAINYNRIYKSTDGGQWWEKIGRDFPEGIDDLLITSDDILFLVSYYNGIFRSMDDGNTWVKTTGGAQGPVYTDLPVMGNGQKYPIIVMEPGAAILHIRVVIRCLLTIKCTGRIILATV